MTHFLEFPIRHNVENLVFSKDGRVTCYYEVEGFGYDFLDKDEKMVPFLNQLGFLQSQERDLHYLCIPQAQDVTSILDRQKKRMELKAKEYQYSLLEQGIEYTKRLEEVLVHHHKTSEKREYRTYIGIQLNPAFNKYKKGNKGTNFLAIIKEFFAGLNSDVNRSLGLEATDILRSEIQAYAEQAEALEQDLKRAYTRESNRQLKQSVRPLQTEEVIWISEVMYASTPSYRDVSYRSNFMPGEKIMVSLDKKEVEAVRPTPTEYLDIQSSYLEEIDPHTLRLTKEVEDEKESLYTRLFVLSKFLKDEYLFPGSEWLYEMQRALTFPVLTSVRLHHKNNQKILKELSNVKLEFVDQRNQAEQAGVAPDLSVTRNQKGVLMLEDYFQTTGYPSYVSSFVFRINATSQKQLEARCETFKKLMQTFQIGVEAPFGEQPSLFMEMLPGSKQLFDAFKVETDPRLLAGMMFSAKSQLGDDAGLFLGETMQGKPVFVFPELASKAFSNVQTAFHSISMMVAGATGYGKSVLANLIVYLAVLNGAFGFIIDPKGDRKKWKNGLPFIPKNQIGIWELGKDEQDKGTLDPFRIAPNVASARTVATNIFSYLVNAQIGDYQYSFLSQAFKYAGKQNKPCVYYAIAYLKELYTEEKNEMNPEKYKSLDHLITVLDTFADEPLISLLISRPDQETRSLDIHKPLQILMVENLSLPKNDKDPAKYTITEKISTAILISITSFTQTFMMHGERTRHKIVLQDEASVLKKNDEGQRLLDFTIRQGRHFNTTLISGTQNASDYNSSDVQNIGMKFCFAMKKTEEAKEMLGFFDLPATQENITTLKNLPLGHCLFMDNYGRTDILRVNPMFKQVLEIFDSSTKSDSENSFEQQNYTTNAPNEHTPATKNEELVNR